MEILFSKYHNSKVELALLRQTNDDLCRKYGLSIIESDKSEKENNIADTRIQNYNRNSGKMELIKQDIDEAIKKSTKYQEFVDELAYKGYYLKKSNNSLSISTPYFNRNIRLARAFGEDYTFENIKDRIYYRNYKPKENKIYKIKIYEGVKINQFLLEHSSFYRIYVHFLYVLGKLPPKIHYIERTPEYYKELDKLDKMMNEFNMINIHDIKTLEDVQNLRTKYLEEISPLKAQKEEYMKLYNQTQNNADKTILKARINHLNEDIEKINKKLQTCRRIISKAEKGAKEEMLIQKRTEVNKEKAEKEIAKKKDRKRER